MRVETDEFISVFYEFLNNRDISNIKITKPIITAKYVEMCKHFIPAEILFLESFIMSEESGCQYLTKEEDRSDWISSRRFYQLYTNYCEGFGIKKEVILSHPKFTLSITNLNIGIFSFKKGGDTRYGIDLKVLKSQMIKRNYMIRDEDDTEELNEVLDDTDYSDEFADYKDV
jgi:hypothetical protein